MTPHPPYEVYSAKVYHARDLTKSGAEKRTFHYDLNVTDYPAESWTVDFVVGGAGLSLGAVLDLHALPSWLTPDLSFSAACVSVPKGG